MRPGMWLKNITVIWKEHTFLSELFHLEMNSQVLFNRTSYSSKFLLTERRKKAYVAYVFVEADEELQDESWELGR